MLGSFSIISVLAHAQDMAEQRKMLITSMMRKSTPNATHNQSSHAGWIPSQSAATKINFHLKFFIIMTVEKIVFVP
jgi:hypothetical protein